MLQVGDITIASITDGAINLPARTGFPDETDPDWIPYGHDPDADGNLPSAVGPFLVRSPPLSKEQPWSWPASST